MTKVTFYDNKLYIKYILSFIVEYTSSYFTFYTSYCKDAAVIILRYTTLRHNGLYEVIHISPLGTV